MGGNAQRLSDKRILLLLPSFEPGGAERQAMYFALYLKKSGCDVRVWGHVVPTGAIAEQCNEAGIPCGTFHFRRPCRAMSLFRYCWRMVQALRRERPDAILSYTTWPNIISGLAWRWSPAKACIWGQRNSEDLNGDALERYAYRQVSAVICNASHEIQYLRNKLGEDYAPISVIHNGFDLEPCQKSREEWRADLGISPDTTVVTMLAHFRYQKDHQTLLCAWRRVLSRLSKSQAAPCLLLAGRHQESYESVRLSVSEMGLDNTVKFLGQVKDVSGLLSATDIGVLSSRHEGISNAILEYMASGLPVIATDLPGNRDALGCNPIQTLCKPGDEYGIANKIRLFMHDPDLRREVGQFNKNRVFEEFSMESMCRGTEIIIADLLENTGKRPEKTAKFFQNKNCNLYKPDNN